VSEPNKTLAFLAYLLTVPGWLYVLLFRRDDRFAVFHAKQSAVLTIVAIGTPLVWLVAGWILSWIPLVGFILAVVLFSLVIAAYAVLIADWIIGMVFALQLKRTPLPVVGGWAKTLPILKTL
jgi:uncharacterized membrane protein